MHNAIKTRRGASNSPADDGKYAQQADEAYERRPPETSSLEPKARREPRITVIPARVDSFLYYSEGKPYTDKKSSEIKQSRYYKSQHIDREFWTNAFSSFAPNIVKEKTEASWFSPTLFKTEGARKNDQAVAIWFLVFDVDAGQTFDEAVSLVRPYQAFVYTSFSHQQPKRQEPPCDRLRIVLPMAVPFFFSDHDEQGVLSGVDVWSRVYLAVAKSLAVPADEACKDAARLFYMPCCIEENGIHYKQVKCEGAFFTIDPEIIETVKATLRKEVEEKTKNRATLNSPKQLREKPTASDRKNGARKESLAEVQSALNTIDPCLGYVDWRNIIFALHAEFAATPLGDAALDAIIEWSARSDKFIDGEVDGIWGAAKLGEDCGQLITMGTFWFIAKQHGYNRPSSVEDQSTSENATSFASYAQQLRARCAMQEPPK
jgi:Primase C terminal 2 (PriCT-2)